jgi:hypothetical protein
LAAWRSLRRAGWAERVRRNRFIAPLYCAAWRSFWRNKAIAPYFIVILSLGWVNRGVWHAEACRGFAKPLVLPHGDKGLLDVLTKSIRIEQGR